MLYELRVTLKDVGISVWRKIQVDGRTTFSDLHRILQIAFEWQGSHLHEYYVKKTNGKKVDNIFISSDEEENFNLFGKVDSFDEKEETVADWLKLAKDKIIYTYDFGDNWEHEIVFTKKVQPEENAYYPCCVGASNLAPPEDSRGEVIMGEVNLEYKNSKELVEEINSELMYELSVMDIEPANEIDYWEELLIKSKEFQQLRPWEKMGDHTTFAVEDPVTNEILFCSVMGGAGEVFGLAVYIGEDGYRSLMRIMEGEGYTMSLAANQRSIVLSFEDREDLNKDEYRLIKSYEVPFRGRKSWPSYRSYQPGYYPWLLDQDEARLMLLALEQTMEVCKEIESGLKVPDLWIDGEVYIKVPNDKNENAIFENAIMILDDYGKVDLSPVNLAVSEFELRMLDKKKKVAASIEFVVDYIDMPIQDDGEERPIFPLLALAVEHNQGLIIHQSIISERLNPEIVQRELIKMFQTVGGIPETLLMDPETARMIDPLEKWMKLSVQTENYPSIARDAIEEMLDMMSFK